MSIYQKCIALADMPRKLSGNVTQLTQALLSVVANLYDRINVSPGELPIAGGTSVAVKTATANVAASATDSVLVVGVPGKSIRVLGYWLSGGDTAGSDVTIGTKLGVGVTAALTATHQLGVNSVFVVPQSDNGWFQTAEGAALVATTGAGSTTGIQVAYIEI